MTAAPGDALQEHHFLFMLSPLSQTATKQTAMTEVEQRQEKKLTQCVPLFDKFAKRKYNGLFKHLLLVASEIVE